MAPEEHMIRRHGMTYTVGVDPERSARGLPTRRFFFTWHWGYVMEEIAIAYLTMCKESSESLPKD